MQQDSREFSNKNKRKRISLVSFLTTPVTKPKIILAEPPPPSTPKTIYKVTNSIAL